MTCPDCERNFQELEAAWKTIDELQRRLLIIGNAVRGTDRYLNGRKHQGRQVNVVADGTRGMERGR